MGFEMGQVVEKANERRSYGSDKLDVVKRTNSSLKSDVSLGYFSLKSSLGFGLSGV